MARMGAIMAAGLLDAGGRNAVPGLRSGSGFFRRTAIIGLAIFTQYWYWYPLAYAASLALQPAVLIALDGDMRQPRLQVALSNCSYNTHGIPSWPGPLLTCCHVLRFKLVQISISLFVSWKLQHL